MRRDVIDSECLIELDPFSSPLFPLYPSAGVIESTKIQLSLVGARHIVFVSAAAQAAECLSPVRARRELGEPRERQIEVERACPRIELLHLGNTMRSEETAQPEMKPTLRIPTHRGNASLKARPARQLSGARR